MRLFYLYGSSVGPTDDDSLVLDERIALRYTKTLKDNYGNCSGH